MKPVAEIIHQTRGRTRLKVPGKRRDGQFFFDIEKQLAKLPGIEAVKGNPLSSSILLQHPDAGHDDTISTIKKLGVFDSIETASAPKTSGSNPEAITEALTELEGTFSDYAQKQHSLLFTLLIGLAIVQILRGNIMAPAIPLLGYAIEIALKDKYQSNL